MEGFGGFEVVQEELEGLSSKVEGTGLDFVAEPGQGWHQQDGLEGCGGSESVGPRMREFSATPTVTGNKHQRQEPSWAD